MHPRPRTAYSRSFPLHMSRGKSLGGCQVLVRTGECQTLGGQAHARHVPHPTTAKHRHLTARHIPRLMLHYTPRFRLCWGQGSIVPPCMHGQAVKVLAWMFSPMRRHVLMPLAGMGFSAIRR